MVRKKSNGVFKMVKRLMAMLLLSSIAFAEDLNNLPPPPPPQSNQPNQNQPQVVVEEKTIKDMSEKELKKFLKDLDKKEQIIRQQDFLKYGGYKELYLRETNTFYYSSSLPVLFVYPKDIDSVVMYAGSGKVMYDKNNLIFIPPKNEDGKFASFIVIFQDKTAHYFVGERVTISDKEKREITTYYRFVEPVKVPVERIIESFMMQYKRCPADKETINVGGTVYRFEKLDRSFLKDENEFYCNTYMRIIEVK